MAGKKIPPFAKSIKISPLQESTYWKRAATALQRGPISYDLGFFLLGARVKVKDGKIYTKRDFFLCQVHHHCVMEAAESYAEQPGEMVGVKHVAKIHEP